VEIETTIAKLGEISLDREGPVSNSIRTGIIRSPAPQLGIPDPASPAGIFVAIRIYHEIFAHDPTDL